MSTIEILPNGIAHVELGHVEGAYLEIDGQVRALRVAGHVYENISGLTLAQTSDVLTWAVGWAKRWNCRAEIVDLARLEELTCHHLSV